MPKFFIILSLILLNIHTQSQDLLGINRFGKLFQLTISPNNEEYLTYPTTNEILNLNPIEEDMELRMKFFSNLQVFFGRFLLDKYSDSTMINEARLIKFDAYDGANLFFLESKFLKEPEYSYEDLVPMLFENDSSDLMIKVQNSSIEAIDKKTNNSVWDKYIPSGFDVFSFGEKCGYHNPVPVLLGKKLLALKNRRYLFLPFKYSRIILIDWETGKEEIIINKGYNLQVSPDGRYFIYESKKNRERSKFIIYNLHEKKIVKELYVKQLYFI